MCISYLYEILVKPKLPLVRAILFLIFEIHLYSQGRLTSHSYQAQLKTNNFAPLIIRGDCDVDRSFTKKIYSVAIIFEGLRS